MVSQDPLYPSGVRHNISSDQPSPFDTPPQLFSVFLTTGYATFCHSIFSGSSLRSWVSGVLSSIVGFGRALVRPYS